MNGVDEIKIGDTSIWNFDRMKDKIIKSDKLKSRIDELLKLNLHYSNRPINDIGIVAINSNYNFQPYNITDFEKLREFQLILFLASLAKMPDELGHEQITSDNCLFELYVMSANTCPARNVWSVPIVSKLKEIGIHMAIHVSTSWSVIIPLTFGSDVPSPYGGINSTGDLTGWDLFFVGYSWNLDYNPIDLYDSASIRPNGDNFYNFPGDVAELDGVSWDDLLDSYLSEMNDTERVNKLKTIQRFFYEWEPVAPILYPQTVWVCLDDVRGFDPLQTSISSQPWELVDCDRTISNSSCF